MMAHHGGLLNFQTSIISPFGFCDKKCQVPNQLIFVCEGYKDSLACASRTCECMSHLDMQHHQV